MGISAFILRVGLIHCVIVVCCAGAKGQPRQPHIDSVSIRHAAQLSEQLNLNTTQYDSLVVLEKRHLLAIDSLRRNGAKLNAEIRKASIQDIQYRYQVALYAILTKRQRNAYEQRLNAQLDSSYRRIGKTGVRYQKL